MGVVELNHPLVSHKLTVLRNKKTGTKEFRELIGALSMILCYEAMKDAELKEKDTRKSVLFVMHSVPTRSAERQCPRG